MTQGYPTVLTWYGKTPRRTSLPDVLSILNWFSLSILISQTQQLVPHLPVKAHQRRRGQCSNWSRPHAANYEPRPHLSLCKMVLSQYLSPIGILISAVPLLLAFLYYKWADHWICMESHVFQNCTYSSIIAKTIVIAPPRLLDKFKFCLQGWQFTWWRQAFTCWVKWPLDQGRSQDFSRGGGGSVCGNFANHTHFKNHAHYSQTKSHSVQQLGRFYIVAHKRVAS